MSSFHNKSSHPAPDGGVSNFLTALAGRVQLVNYDISNIQFPSSFVNSINQMKDVTIHTVTWADLNLELIMLGMNEAIMRI